MEVPESITVYPIYPLDWYMSYQLSWIMSLTKHKIVNRNTLAMLIFKDEDSQHFVVESSSTKEDSAITSDFSDPELKRVNTILSTYPNVNIVSNTRTGIYRLQIEIDMTKKEVTMITNIINPLLQAVSFISIWYLYQTMSKVKATTRTPFYFLFFVLCSCSVPTLVS